MLAVLLAVLVIWAVVIIHEAGHFVACLLMNIPVESFELGSPIGPRLHLRLGKYSLRVSLLPFEGGVVPRREEGKDSWQITPGRLAVFSAAGPIANLLSAGALALTLGLGDKFWFSLTPFGLFSLRFGSINVPLAAIAPLIILLVEGPEGVLPAFAVLSVMVAIFSLLPSADPDGESLRDGDLVVEGILAKFNLSERWASLIVACCVMLPLLSGAIISVGGIWVRLSQWLF